MKEILLKDRERMQKHVDQLESTLASVQEQVEKDKMIEWYTELCNDALVQLESESLEKRADLESTLATVGQQEEPEKEKIKEEVEEKTTAGLQNIIRLEDSLNIFEDLEKTKVLESESLLRDREQLQKCVDQLEATLASEQEQQEQEQEKIKQDMEEKTTALFQNIAGLKTVAELERESMMRDREKLENLVAQLEANLASEREQQEQEKKATGGIFCSGDGNIGFRARATSEGNRAKAGHV
ncbi:hypothetical protein KOW79_005024 [Hemibagrus wyckioides]|uniref:Uncharacterized protein n=1 Tax=Hemibagrus wyckioides TaxID=337641 RepID=A0A9D3SPT1_9TELE|nr:hypothetical protein KOW79_005024 [Hemibagrus wyckioides]